MLIANIKEKVLKTTIGRVLALAIVVIILFFYFRAFNTTGVEFEDSFLVKETMGSDKHYVGNGTYGKMKITVLGNSSEEKNIVVIFDLPNNVYKEYTVKFKEPERSNDIKILDQDGNILFEGEYRKNSMFLFTKSGEPYFDDMVRIRIGGRSPFNDDYNVSYSTIVNYAIGANETIRGNYELLFIAIIVLAITLFDMKFPLFFFYLRNFLDVKDPEPSDFYLAMQKISWYVMPIIAIILMITALF